MVACGRVSPVFPHSQQSPKAQRRRHSREREGNPPLPFSRSAVFVNHPRPPRSCSPWAIPLAHINLYAPRHGLHPACAATGFPDHQSHTTKNGQDVAARRDTPVSRRRGYIAGPTAPCRRLLRRFYRSLHLQTCTKKLKRNKKHYPTKQSKARPSPCATTPTRFLPTLPPHKKEAKFSHINVKSTVSSLPAARFAGCAAEDSFPAIPPGWVGCICIRREQTAERRVGGGRERGRPYGSLSRYRRAAMMNRGDA